MSDYNSYKKDVFSYLNNGIDKTAAIEAMAVNHGISKKTASKWFNRLKNEYYENDHDTQINLSGDKQIVDNSKLADIKTLPELLLACNVDTKIWDVNDFSIEKTDSSNRDGTISPKFKVRASLEKREVAKYNVLESFIENARKHSPAKFNFRKFDNNNDKLYLINLFDLHLAKYAWAQQVGEDYDIKIAANLYDSAVDYFYNKIKNTKVDRILLPIGNDFFNYDREGTGGKDGGTLTRAGTAVESDSRWQKMFTVGCKLVTDTIEKLSLLAPVDVIVVIANHDETISQYLGYYLEAWFKNNPNVAINNSPKTRKYYIYGKNLLGFTHSNFEKFSQLPLIMAKEMEKEWSNTTVRDWYCSHWHVESLEEYNGVRVRVIPALCAVDSYHFKHGFIGNNRAGQGFLYEKSGGLTDIHYFNIKGS